MKRGIFADAGMSPPHPMGEPWLRWQAIADTPIPHNHRVVIAGDGDHAPDDEMAMAWLDRLDDRLYYAPQGGLVTWTPTHWAELPDGPVKK